MHIRRRPSAATFVAIVATLVIGTQTGLAAGSQASRGAPDPVSSLEVTAADNSSVSIAWPPSRANDVTGYTVYLDGARVGTQSPNQLKPWRDRDALTYTLQQLACGTAYTIGVDVYDHGDRHSETTTTTVSTAACPDRTPPSAPSGIRQVAATEHAVMLTWTPSTDNVGVSGYGLYAGGLRVATSSDASATLTNLTCGTSYLVAIDAADAAGNRSTQATTYLATSACPSSSTSGSSPTTTGSPPPAPAAAAATTALAPSASGTGTVMQTIANGSTIPNIANWRAVYDRNGDGKEDDPGKIEFRVDGQLILSEQLIPFGDSFDSSWAVTPGSHTFQVRAISDTGTLLATNTATATVANPTTPSPRDTTAPSQPSGLRVTSATATSATVAWNASVDDVGVARYDIYRGGSVAGSSTTTSYAMNGLACGTAYSVGVKAVDAAGNASSQGTISITTSACADTQPPTAPGNVTASTRTATSISLTWAPASDNVGVTGYRVYNGANVVQTTAGTTGIASGLTCGTNYTLAVDAVDASANSSPKTTVMVSTLACADTSPPTQPTNLRLASATTTTATLAWSASADNVAVTGYDVYRAGTRVGSATTTSYPMSGLTCGTTYSVGVRALDAAGNASPQASASISTTACATPPPPASTTCPLPAFPDAGCTGVPAGTVLTPSGGLTISTAGTVIDGRDITGQVVVNAPNVTIRNSRIRTNSMWAIDNNSTGLLVEDSEIINRPVSGQPNCHNAIGDANFTVRRTEIAGCENGANITGPNVTFEDNYVHDLDTTGPSYVWGNSPHTDGIQVGATDNLVIRHNSIDPVGSVTGGGATSGIIMDIGNSNTPNPNTWIENNYIDGRDASYAIYAPRYQTHDVYINGNRLYRGAYGYTACVRLGVTVTQFNDNRDFGTGAVISPDSGAGGSCSN